MIRQWRKVSSAAGRRVPVFVLLCVYLLMGMPLHAQQEQISAAIDAEAKMPAVTANGAASARPLSPGDAREDLTVFFTIGIVVDVLLVAAFLVWAIGQWRKPRK